MEQKYDIATLRRHLRAKKIEIQAQIDKQREHAKLRRDLVTIRKRIELMQLVERIQSERVPKKGR